MTSDELLTLKGMAVKSAILDPISKGLSKLALKGVNKLLSKQNEAIKICSEQKALNDRIRQVYTACKDVQALSPEAKEKMTQYILTGEGID